MHGWLLVCKAIQAQTEHSITFHFNTPMMLVAAAAAAAVVQ
jgi:hypothetical protein